MAAKEMTTAAALLRAAELGREVEAIAADVGLQRLSKAAWLAMAAELAGGADLAELRQRVEALPYLWRLVGQTAHRWGRDQQDRPVPDPVFADGDNATAAYVERLTGGVSVGEASAVVAAIVAETAEPGRWGRLESFAQVPALLEPLERELLELDAQLVAELRLADLHWTGQGASLRAGEVVAVLDSAAAARPASAIAEGARNAARGVQLAA